MATNTPVTARSETLPSTQILQLQAGDFVFADDVVHGAVPDEVDLLVGQGAVRHDLRRLQGIAAVNNRYGLGELGEEEGLLHGGVTTADDGNVLILEKETVTGCTPAYAVS